MNIPYLKRLACALLWFTAPLSSALAFPGVGDPAPNISATTLSGNPVDLHESLKKGPAFLIFWATWCPNCLREVPQLKALHAEYGEKMHFVGVNIGIGDTEDAARAYQQEHGLAYDMVFDGSGKVINDYGVAVTPVLIIVDQEGNVAYRGNEPPNGADIEEYWEDLVR